MILIVLVVGTLLARTFLSDVFAFSTSIFAFESSSYKRLEAFVAPHVEILIVLVEKALLDLPREVLRDFLR